MSYQIRYYFNPIKALQQRYQSEQALQLKDPAVIKFLDDACFENVDEFIKSLYTFPYLKAKQKQLIEYYRYHNDVPRIFMKYISGLFEQYHVSQREIRYKRIKLHLGMPVEQSQHEIHEFKALDGLTEIGTSRVLLQMLTSIKEVSIKPKLKLDKIQLSNLISLQKQQLQVTVLKKILSNPISPTNKTKKQLIKQPTMSHRKVITHYTQYTQQTQQTQQSEPSKEDFIRKWSNIASSRELQITKNRLKARRIR